NVSPPHANTQNSQPMLEPNGTIVDSYVDYGLEAADEGSEAAEARTAHNRSVPAKQAASEKASDYPALVTAVSKDGGATWSHGGTITRDLGDGPPGFRCCLPSSTADPVSGRLYASWNSADPTKVKLSSSTNGKRWSKPVGVNRRDQSLLGVSSDVAAYDGAVSVTFGLTNADTRSGRFGRQFVATSHDRGRHFLAPTAVGPQINYAYAAIARGIFPGDYVGSSMTKGRLYAVWAVSSAANAKYHQVIFGASFDTSSTPLKAAAPTNERAAVTRP
ncbi:MAG TPA: sialidase family protein, partial [Friedmanniella sp.]